MKGTSAKCYSESDLSSSNTYAVRMENTSANGNEVGLGAGLSAANRTLTQNGNIPGAVRACRRRYLTTNDYFTGTATLWNLLVGKTYTIIIKAEDWSAGYLAVFFDDAQNYLQLRNDRVNQVIGNVEVMGTFAASVPSTGVIFYAVWADNTNNIRAGWIKSNTEPTTWNKFPPSQRKEGATNGDTTGISYLAGSSGIGARIWNNDNFITGYIHYIRISNTCLITN